MDMTNDHRSAALSYDNGVAGSEVDDVFPDCDLPSIDEAVSSFEENLESLFKTRAEVFKRIQEDPIKKAEEIEVAIRVGKPVSEIEAILYDLEESMSSNRESLEKVLEEKTQSVAASTTVVMACKEREQYYCSNLRNVLLKSQHMMTLNVITRDNDVQAKDQQEVKEHVQVPEVVAGSTPKSFVDGLLKKIQGDGIATAQVKSTDNQVFLTDDKMERCWMEVRF